MTCPFLKETQVKYCQTAAVRKLIPLANTGRTEEKCSSDAYVSCPVYRSQHPEESASAHCPYLRESLMQYCGAAPVAKLVPYSESLLSRCGNDSFRYCELYLSMAHPDLSAAEVDGIPVPDWLSYSPNHLWLDVTDDGVCHVGIDAFLSRALGPIEGLTYVWTKGRHRPTAVLTVGGMNLEVVFPNSFLLTNCNLYLRADPARITDEPYTGGWLFEGVPEPGTRENLIPGAEAHAWMAREQHRIHEFLQQQPGPAGPCAADGGMFAAGLVKHLDRGQVLTLFHQFFSPYASGKRETSQCEE
jgi:glycine cleavage system H lipoate-binding protein